MFDCDFFKGDFVDVHYNEIKIDQQISESQFYTYKSRKDQKPFPSTQADINFAPNFLKQPTFLTNNFLVLLGDLKKLISIPLYEWNDSKYMYQISHSRTN